jgi:pimeloyl-ACP methyl ester carboxylesterase
MAVALKVVVRRPDLAAGLVLLDGAVLLPEAQREGLGRLAQALETDGWRDALLGFFGGIAAGAADRVRADIAAMPRVYAAPLMRDIVSCISSDHAQELAAVRCPLKYVHGRMPLDLERFRELRPDAIVETIPDVGHYLMLTAPAKVNAALDQFLETIR